MTCRQELQSCWAVCHRSGPAWAGSSTAGCWQPGTAAVQHPCNIFDLAKPGDVCARCERALPLQTKGRHLLAVHVHGKVIDFDPQQSAPVPPRPPQPGAHSHQVLTGLATRGEPCFVAQGGGEAQRRDRVLLPVREALLQPVQGAWWPALYRSRVRAKPHSKMS